MAVRIPKINQFIESFREPDCPDPVWMTPNRTKTHPPFKGGVLYRGLSGNEQNLLLEAFWIAASTAFGKDERLGLLKRLSALQVVAPKHRHARDVELPPQRTCWCCLEERTTEWHHIIPVKCGGRTERFNLLPLCEDCHFGTHVEALATWRILPSLKPHARPTPEVPPAPREPHPASKWPYGYPMVALSDLDPERLDEHYEELAAKYNKECADRDYFRAQCEMDIQAMREQIQEEEFAVGNFESVENELERERLEHAWAEREEERLEMEEEATVNEPLF